MIFRDDNIGVKGMVNDFHLDQIPWGDWFYVDVTDFLPKDVDFPSLMPNFQFSSLQDIRSVKKINLLLP